MPRYSFIPEPIGGGTGNPIGSPGNKTPAFGTQAPFQSQAWRPFDDATRAFYEDNPQAAWSQYTGDMFGPDSYQNVWASQQFGDAFAEYLRRSEGTPEMNFVDFLTKDYAQGLGNRFANLSASRRGERMPVRGPRIVW